MKHELLLLPALLLLACSSDEGNEPKAGAGRPRGPAGGIVEADPDSIPVTPHVNPSAGSAGAGALGGTSGSGGSGGASGAPAVEFVSNPAGAVLDLVIVEGEPGLEVLNSNSQQYGVASILVEWFAEVRNDGQSIACYPRADIELRDAADTIIWQTDALGAFVDTKPYFVPEQTTSTVPCLAPGEVGVLYTNGLEDAPIAIESISRIHVEMSSDVYAGTELHPDPPTFAGLGMKEFIVGGGTWLVEGDLTAAAGMELIDVDVYLRNPLTGFYEDRRFANRIELLSAGETWHFESNNGENGPYSNSDMTPFVRWYYP